MEQFVLSPFAPRNLRVLVLVCVLFGAGCATWEPTNRQVVSKSGEPYLFTQKYKFDGDLRVALTDSSIVELKKAYALEYTLFGTAESGSMEIPFEDIIGVEEKHSPEGINSRSVVVVGILVLSIGLVALSGS
jgi:hypothetical protein